MSLQNKKRCKAEAREAELIQRRRVAYSDEEGIEEDGVSPPDVDISRPSTSGVRVREDIALHKPIKVMARPPADLGQDREGRDEVVEVVDDTEVENDKEEEREEMEGVREEEEDSDFEAPPKLLRKKGRGRPALVPGHEGQFTGDKIAARALERRERILAEEQRKALDPATELRIGPRLAKARREEKEMIIKSSETSAAGLKAVVMEQVVMLRKVAQRCSNLKSTTTKALWDATVTISAASAALNLRAQSSGAAVASPEWEDMREELRQLRADWSHLRASHEDLKEELQRAQEEKDRLRKELEGVRKERRKREEEESKKEEKSEKEIDPLQRLPPRDSSPIRLRPRSARRVIIDESKEEEVEIEEVMEMPACPPSPEPDCRPNMGEVIPQPSAPPQGDTG